VVREVGKWPSQTLHPYWWFSGMKYAYPAILRTHKTISFIKNNVPGTLYTLTTENLEPVVNDWTKDVLVIFYGPKCPYSKFNSQSLPLFKCAFYLLNNYSFAGSF
jgi:hypothetical protein